MKMLLVKVIDTSTLFNGLVTLSGASFAHTWKITWAVFKNGRQYSCIWLSIPCGVTTLWVI